MFAFLLLKIGTVKMYNKWLYFYQYYHDRVILNNTQEMNR
ncbi:hypothetical protein T479_22200 [Lysinibacillus varians]|nr:hypothetical protein T479_22200 [Lysinibacillus varians]